MTSIETRPARTGAATDDPGVGREVVFLGTHGQANIGDELLLDTFLGELGPEHHYTVNSYDPGSTAAMLEDRFDVTVFDTAGSRLELLRHLRRADVVVFGGGNIVKELYRSTGRWKHSTLCMILAIVAYVRLVARRPILMSNVGVGPLPSRTGKLLGAVILRLVDLVSVRDEASLETCLALGCPRDKVRLVPDAVWSRGPDSLRGSADTPRPADDGVLRVALNLNRDVEAADDWDVFQRRIAEALELVVRQADVEVEIHALPMQSSYKDATDLDVLEEVLGAVDTRTVLHAPADHEAVADIIDRCDVVVSERLHAIVLAAILRRPVVALPYDMKVRALVEQLGLQERSFPADASLDPRRLAATIIEAGADQGDESARLGALAERRRLEATAHFAEVRGWIAAPYRRWPTTEVR